MEVINITRRDPKELTKDESNLLLCLTGAFGKKWIAEGSYKGNIFYTDNFAYEPDEILWFIRKEELIEALPLTMDVNIASKSIKKVIENLNA